MKRLCTSVALVAFLVGRPHLIIFIALSKGQRSFLHLQPDLDQAAERRRATARRMALKGSRKRHACARLAARECWRPELER